MRGLFFYQPVAGQHPPLPDNYCMKKPTALLALLSSFALACGGLASLAREASCEDMGARNATAAEMTGAYTRTSADGKPSMTLDASGRFMIQDAGCLTGMGGYTLDKNQFNLTHDALGSGCRTSDVPVLTVCEQPGGVLTIMEQDAFDPDQWTVWQRS
jgi:hypothetical protein